MDSCHLSSEEREALKQEIFSSLHCALPGIVASYDAERQTADVQPAVKLKSLNYPVLSDVPVFMPIPFGVNPGDPCLVIFADLPIDAWLNSGIEEAPASARCHDLSDAFAFVGFRSKPNALQSFPDTPSFFGQESDS